MIDWLEYFAWSRRNTWELWSPWEVAWLPYPEGDQGSGSNMLRCIRIYSVINGKNRYYFKLKGLYRKNKRGYRLKPKHFSSWSRPMRVLSDVPVSRNWYKLCQIYTNICMYKSLYKNSRFKRIIFIIYTTNLKTIYEILRLRIFGIWSVLYYNLSKLHIY